MDAAPPLIAIAAAPVPGQGSAEWFTGAGGARLRAALFHPAVPPRGSVVVSPGRTEPIEKYFEVAEDLLDRGFVVLIHDWRGQGLSHRPLTDRTLGHATGHGDFLADYRALLDAFAARLPKPWLALGHSMGGCLTLLALAKGEPRFSGALLSAPMLGLRTDGVPRPVARALAAVMVHLGASATPVVGRASSPAKATFANNILTHDRARYERNAAQIEAFPDLALGSPTWGWLDFAFSAIDVLARADGVGRIATPVTVVAAGDDRLVDNAGLRRVTARIPGARYVEIAGAFHELPQETDAVRAMFWGEFDDLVARSRPN